MWELAQTSRIKADPPKGAAWRKFSQIMERSPNWPQSVDGGKRPHDAAAGYCQSRCQHQVIAEGLDRVRLASAGGKLHKLDRRRNELRLELNAACNLIGLANFGTASS